MKKEKHFRILPDFMIRTAMLPLESINEIKTGDEFLTSLEKFIDEGVMYKLQGSVVTSFIS